MPERVGNKLAFALYRAHGCFSSSRYLADFGDESSVKPPPSQNERELHDCI
jgi:hypothetical protein